MHKKQKIKLFLSSLTPVSTIPFLIACGTTVTSPEKIKEDELLVSDKTKKFIELKYVENILLNKIYNKENKELLVQFNDSNSKFYKDAFAAFDFYQKFQVNKNPSFTTDFVSKLKKDNLISQDEVDVLSREMGPNKYFSEASFKYIYFNVNTEIREVVNKMLFVKNFLTNLTEEEIKNSKRYKNNSADSNNNYNQREIYKSISSKNKNFFLNALLLEKQPAQIWKFESSNSNDINTYSQFKIKDEKTFNSLIDDRNFNTANTTKEQEFEKIGVNDSLNTSALLAYKGILYNQGSSAKNDFNYYVDVLKNQGQIKSGFVDEENRYIYSKIDLDKAASWKGKKEIAIKLKDSFDKKKEKYAIQAEDFEFPKASENSQVLYEVIRIIPNKNESVKKGVSVLVRMSLKADTSIKKSYRFYSIDVNWTNDKATYIPEISEQGREIKNVISEVKIVNEDFTKISATYMNKIVPLYNQKVVEKDKYNYFFSLDGTPWENEESKTKLAFSLFLSDKDTIFNDVKKFYEEQGFTIEYKEDILNPDKKESKK